MKPKITYRPTLSTNGLFRFSENNSYMLLEYYELLNIQALVNSILQKYPCILYKN